MKIGHFLSSYRWPIFLGAILGMSIIAQGVLVFVATRPDAPRPIARYYERSLAWDADAAVAAQSRRLGWTVKVEVPAGEHYAVAARRPVDISIGDDEGQPVTALEGRLVAVRPADIRRNGESTLVELPHAPGHYRSLAPLSAPGIWELSIDVHRGDTRFMYTERVVIRGSGER